MILNKTTKTVADRQVQECMPEPSGCKRSRDQRRSNVHTTRVDTFRGFSGDLIIDEFAFIDDNAFSRRIIP